MTSGVRKIVFFLLLVGVICLAYQSIRKANSGLVAQKARVEANLAKLTEFEEATAAVEDITKQLSQLQEAVEFFESKLPPESEIHKVLEQVTVIAQKHDLVPKTIRTMKRKKSGSGAVAAKDGAGSRYIEQPLKMELTGDFNSFYGFLLELEKLPRIMKIRELELKKQTQKDGEISAKFTVSVFFQNA